MQSEERFLLLGELHLSFDEFCEEAILPEEELAREEEAVAEGETLG